MPFIKASGKWFWLAALAALAISSAWAEPGYQWEMSMQMDGMSLPGMGGGQAQCLPAKGAQNPGMDDKCKPLESKQTGNRFYWKAMCDGVLTTGDFTYQGDTAYKGTVTIEEGRDKHVMKMSGKRLGKCEYSPPRIAMPVAPKINCDESIQNLEPALVFGGNALCASKKKEFCARLGDLSPEGFARVADRVKMEGTPEAQAVKGYARMTDALKSCNMRLSDMQSAQCRRANQALDYDFMGRYCPAEMKALCASGRAYTGMCSGSAGRGDSGGEDRGGSGSAGGYGSGGKSNQGSGQGSGDGGIGEGLNKLKGLFGF